MNRRDLLKTAAAIAGVPFSAQAQAQLASATWTPAVLDDHQNRTVIALTELIIPATDTPGAKVANVNRYIDLICKDGDTAQRDRFLSGLAALDAQTIRAHGHPFAACSVEQQTATLTRMDQSGDPFFRFAKSITTRIYYATQTGFRELNKGGRVPATFGCHHTSHGAQ